MERKGVLVSSALSIKPARTPSWRKLGSESCSKCMWPNSPICWGGSLTPPFIITVCAFLSEGWNRALDTSQLSPADCCKSRGGKSVEYFLSLFQWLEQWRHRKSVLGTQHTLMINWAGASGVPRRSLFLFLLCLEWVLEFAGWTLKVPGILQSHNSHSSETQRGGDTVSPCGACKVDGLRFARIV